MQSSEFSSSLYPDCQRWRCQHRRHRFEPVELEPEPSKEPLLLRRRRAELVHGDFEDANLNSPLRAVEYRPEHE